MLYLKCFVMFMHKRIEKKLLLFCFLPSVKLPARNQLVLTFILLPAILEAKTGMYNILSGKESRNSQQFLRITPWVLCANGPICVSFKRWFVYLFGCLFSKNLLPTFSTEQHFRMTRRMYIIDVYSPLFLIKRLFSSLHFWVLKRVPISHTYIYIYI